MAPDGEVAEGPLERFVAILDVFAGIHYDPPQRCDGAALGVSDVSRTLGLSKGTVSRYLRRLEGVGLLQRLPDRRYVLASRVYQWGQAAAPGDDVRYWAHPMMEELAAHFGETTSLFVLENDAAVCIDQVDGLFPIRLSAAIGRRLPLHVGASPRLLLAFAPEEQREAVLGRGDLPPLAHATITDTATLRRALEQTQRIGYVLSESESDEGAVGIAAPIRDVRGRVRAALSVAGPANRLEGARREAVAIGVREAAARISGSLGYLLDRIKGVS